MRDVITRFFTLEALNVTPEVYVGLLGLWVLVTLIGLASALSQPIHPAGRLFWALVIIALPLLGLAVYCLFCLTRADYTFVKRLGFGLASKRG